MKDFDFYNRYPNMSTIKDEIEKAIEMIVECYNQGGKVLICGNGGSASDSEHISGELLKGFMLKRPLTLEEKSKLSSIEGGEDIANTLQRGIAAIPLPSLSASGTAFANDCNAEYMFAQEVFALAKEHDILIGISTSGNSKNVVAALKVAKAFGIRSIALTGENESNSSKYATITIKAPEKETYKIQECHLPIYHYICQRVEDILFGDNR